MKTYARIQNGRVAELLKLGSDPSALYHPSLLWIDVSAMPSVALGWEYDGADFTPPQPGESNSAKPSIEELQSRLSLLSAQIEALRKPI